jgi:ribosome biogenesis protein MAK21
MLGLLFKVLEKRGDIGDRYFRLFYEQIQHFELYQTANRQELLGLLKKVVAVDEHFGRPVAFLKRMAQVTLHIDGQLSTSCLLILRDLTLRYRSKMKKLLLRGDGQAAAQARDSDDSSSDSSSDDEENDPKAGKKRPASAGPATNGGPAEKKRKTGEDEASASLTNHYDPTKREPKFCQADANVLWELHGLLHHTHPTVAALGTNFLEICLFLSSLLVVQCER